MWALGIQTQVLLIVQQNILPMDTHSKPTTVCVYWVHCLVLMHKYGLLCFKGNVNSMVPALYINHFFVFSTFKTLYSGYSERHNAFLASVVILLYHTALEPSLLSTCNTIPIDHSFP